ncbi:ribonuclease H-like domain-containing protein [Tanacetum coccineum]
MKKEEYDIWAMEMEHYLEYIANEVWKVIQNGNSKKRISTGKDGIVRILLPVTAAEIQAVEKKRKAKNILLMAIPKEHMRRFHRMDDAKEIWEAIRTSSEGLEKGYDRFQQLLSQLEAHGAEVSTKDTNHKFLRSLPVAWSNLAMTIRTKPEVDTLSIDDFGILQNFIRQIENQLSHRVKIIRSDNGTEFKNRDMLEFCGNKGIKQEYSNARTPQQNGVAERMNRTLILLEEIALKHLGTVPENNSTSTPSFNTSIQTVNTSRLDPDDSPMLDLEIFHKSETGIFDEASYDEEGVITDFNSLPTEIEFSPTPTLRIHNIHPKSQILGDPKSAVQTIRNPNFGLFRDK